MYACIILFIQIYHRFANVINHLEMYITSTWNFILNCSYSIGWVCYDVKRGLEDEKYPFYLEGGFRKPFSEISDNLSSIIGDAEKDVKKALKDCQLRYRFSAPHAEALQKSGPWVAMLLRLIPIHCHALRTTLPNYKYLAYSLHRFQPPVPNWTVIHK